MKLHRNIIPIRCGAGATLRRIAFLLALMLFCAGSARAYDNEVYESEGNYYWKIDNVVQGSSAELFTAIDRCLWDSTGAGREIHILTGGDLSATIGIPGDVSLNGHSNTFHVTHGDYTVWAVGADNIGFYDMTITGASHMVFRVTACDNVVFSGIHIDGGFIGMRVDSRSSQPWLATSYNLTVTTARSRIWVPTDWRPPGLTGATWTTSSLATTASAACSSTTRGMPTWVPWMPIGAAMAADMPVCASPIIAATSG